MVLSDDKLQSLLSAAAEIGAIKALEKAGVSRRMEISQREAYRNYGESRVKRWVHLKKVKRLKLSDKGKVTYSLSELEAADKSERV